MRSALIVISSVLTIVCTLPYLRDIWRGTTKPRIVTWFTWALLTGIAATASFSDGQHASAIFATCATLESIAIVVLGLIKNGYTSFARFDLTCQFAAFVGIGLWLVFDSPTIAVLAVVVIDLISALPTLKHSWQAPHEETLLAYLLAGVAAVFAVAAATNWKITAVAYPIYIVLFNAVVVAILAWRPKKLAQTTEETVKVV